MANILVIDDDEVARLHMGAILEGLGHTVRYAANGEQGVNLFADNPAEVVIVDLAMPVKNGVITIRELTGLDPEARVIAVSGTSPEQLVFAEEAGAGCTLTKPVPPDALRQAVGSLLLRRSRWDEVYF